LAIFQLGQVTAFLAVERNCKLDTVTDGPLIPVPDNMPVAVSSVVSISVMVQFNKFDVSVKLGGRSNTSPLVYRIPSLNTVQGLTANM
jgi:hypothetical protein